MNEDIKDGLNAELPPGRVPFNLDPDKAVELGRRNRKRRRLVAGGGSALSIVAVAAVLVAVLTPGGPTQGDEAANDKKQQVEDDLPELDPDKEYDWSPGGFEQKSTAITEEYSDAFWNHMDTEIPEAEPDYTQYNSENYPQAKPKQIPPALTRDEMELTELTEAPEVDVLYKAPVYTFDYEIEDSENGASSTTALTFQFGDKMPNFVSLEILPKNGYRIGSKDALDQATCSEDYEGKQFDFDCAVSNAKGPNGERIQNVNADTFRDGKLIDTLNKTILYRSDGSAVVISDHLRGRFGGSDDDEGKNIEGSEPALSFEDLAGIAAALPVKPVE